MQDTVDMADDPEFEEEEPSFSDPEDFEDDIEDEGKLKLTGKMPAFCGLPTGFWLFASYRDHSISVIIDQICKYLVYGVSF